MLKVEQTTLESLPINPDANLSFYQIILGDVVIGDTFVGAEQAESRLSINEFKINPNHRNRGYGKKAREILVKRLVEENNWARIISQVVNLEVALKTAISTPVPDGWHRRFTLGIWDSTEEQIYPTLITPKPEVALSWLKNEVGNVDVTYDKSLAMTVKAPI